MVGISINLAHYNNDRRPGGAAVSNSWSWIRLPFETDYLRFFAGSRRMRGAGLLYYHSYHQHVDVDIPSLYHDWIEVH